MWQLVVNHMVGGETERFYEKYILMGYGMSMLRIDSTLQLYYGLASTAYA